MSLMLVMPITLIMKTERHRWRRMNHTTLTSLLLYSVNSHADRLSNIHFISNNCDFQQTFHTGQQKNRLLFVAADTDNICCCRYLYCIYIWQCRIDSFSRLIYRKVSVEGSNIYPVPGEAISRAKCSFSTICRRSKIVLFFCSTDNGTLCENL